MSSTNFSVHLLSDSFKPYAIISQHTDSFFSEEEAYIHHHTRMIEKHLHPIRLTWGEFWQNSMTNCCLRLRIMFNRTCHIMIAFGFKTLFLTLFQCFLVTFVPVDNGITGSKLHLKHSPRRPEELLQLSVCTGPAMTRDPG